jgi:hypothetical protein
MGSITLKEHFKVILKEKDRYLSSMLRERDKAIRTALKQTEKRLVALNELRGDVATKGQVEAIKERLDRMDGRSGGIKDWWGWIIAMIMAGVAIGTLYLHVYK